MRKVCAIFAVLVITLITVSCSSNYSPPDSVILPANSTELVYNSMAEKKIGNYSYLPINKSGNPGDMVDLILTVLNEFEKSHPNLRVHDWKIEKQQFAHPTTSYIYGIWISHAPAKNEDRP